MVFALPTCDQLLAATHIERGIRSFINIVSFMMISHINKSIILTTEKKRCTGREYDTCCLYLFLNFAYLIILMTQWYGSHHHVFDIQ
jgi:hypothetical protein